MRGRRTSKIWRRILLLRPPRKRTSSATASGPPAVDICQCPKYQHPITVVFPGMWTCEVEQWDINHQWTSIETGGRGGKSQMALTRSGGTWGRSAAKPKTRGIFLTSGTSAIQKRLCYRQVPLFLPPRFSRLKGSV